MPCGTGRSLSLLDPTYASKYIPIIASVSEHQPPSWPSYFTDLQARPPCLQILAHTFYSCLHLPYQCLLLFGLPYTVQHTDTTRIHSHGKHVTPHHCTSQQWYMSSIRLCPSCMSGWEMVQAATLLMPAGLIAAFRPLTHASLFLVLYGVTAIYFSGVMVRTGSQSACSCISCMSSRRMAVPPPLGNSQQGMCAKPAETCAGVRPFLDAVIDTVISCL